MLTTPAAEEPKEADDTEEIEDIMKRNGNSMPKPETKTKVNFVQGRIICIKSLVLFSTFAEPNRTKF